ncbi:MAG: GNAT family protein [Bacteroidota bacterium]
MNQPLLNTQVFDTFPQLESDRLVFEQYDQSHAADLLALRSDPLVMKYMDSPPFENIQTAVDRITENRLLFKEENGIVWVIKEKSSDDFVGDFSFWKIDKKNFRGEIGYAMLPRYWGKGYMTETMHTIFAFGFHQLGLHSIVADVNPDNEKSKSVLSKMGFQREAYFRESFYYDGQFLDSLIYCLLVSDFG